MSVRGILTMKAGPLPIIKNFTVTGKQQLLVVSGSVYCTNANRNVGFKVLVDETLVGVCKIHSNHPWVHRTCVSVFVELKLNPQSSPHVLTLLPWTSDTVTDKYDWYEAAIISI